MQVSRWGNSLAVRLPARVVEVLDLKEGDDIEIEVAGERLFLVHKAAGRQQVLERLRAYRGRLPQGFRFNRLDAQDGRG